MTSRWASVNRSGCASAAPLGQLVQEPGLGRGVDPHLGEGQVGGLVGVG